MYVYLGGIPSMQALEHTKEMLGIIIRDTLKLKLKKKSPSRVDRWINCGLITQWNALSQWKCPSTQMNLTNHMEWKKQAAEEDTQMIC